MSVVQGHRQFDGGVILTMYGAFQCDTAVKVAAQLTVTGNVNIAEQVA